MYTPYLMSDVYEASAKNLFTVISTFAGGGGSSTGYRLAGGNVLAMNEFVEEAVNTYKANYPNTKIIAGDIKQLTGQEFLDAAGLQVGELDILDSSPPCSAFSAAGLRDKGWNRTKDYSDGKKVENIENLFLEMIRIADHLKPKILIAENVKGLDVGEAKKKRNEFLNAFESIGYTTTYVIMNGAHYGVPQARERLFFVGIRDDIVDALDIHPMLLNSMVMPEKFDYTVSMYDAIHDIQNDPAEVKMLCDYIDTSFQAKWIDMLPVNPIKTISPADPEFAHVNPNGNFFNMMRPAPHLPCPTLTQNGQQLSASGVFHYEERRKLTIREIKRIMSLPDDYVLTGAYNKQVERCCRMVAPFMLRELAKKVYNEVLLPYKELQ